MRVCSQLISIFLNDFCLSFNTLKQPLVVLAKQLSSVALKWTDGWVFHTLRPSRSEKQSVPCSGKCFNTHLSILRISVLW